MVFIFIFSSPRVDASLSGPSKDSHRNLKRHTLLSQFAGGPHGPSQCRYMNGCIDK